MQANTIMRNVAAKKMIRFLYWMKLKINVAPAIKIIFILNGHK